MYKKISTQIISIKEKYQQIIEKVEQDSNEKKEKEENENKNVEANCFAIKSKRWERKKENPSTSKRKALLYT